MKFWKKNMLHAYSVFIRETCINPEGARYLVFGFKLLNLFCLLCVSHRIGCNRKLSTIDECRSKIDRNSVFDCHLSPVGRQMTIENTVSIDLWSMFLDSIDIFHCCLPSVCMGERTCTCETACRSLHWQPVQYTPKSYDLADASFLHAG